MKSKGSALKRRIQCYPPPGLYNSLINYALSRGLSNSEAAVYMMRCFFDNEPRKEASGDTQRLKR